MTKATSAMFAPIESPVLMHSWYVPLFFHVPSSICCGLSVYSDVGSPSCPQSKQVAPKPPHPWWYFVPDPKSKSAAAMQPQMPQAPCTEKASTGSSILSCLMRAADPVKTKPPRNPIRTAQPDSTFEQGAVTDTKPAKMPLQSAAQSYFLVIAKIRRKTVMPPVAAESVVFIIT